MLYLLSESHFSIHTWPEDEACAIDFYHCGGTAEVRLRVAEKVNNFI
jgi:S-adenosylmethionine/arginine decarboxylase-like enzyme